MKWLVTVLIVVVSSLFVDVSIFSECVFNRFRLCSLRTRFRVFIGSPKPDECRFCAEES
jgi:hypothetical protein